MKKVLITMAVLASMVAGAMVLSSFTAPKQDDTRQISKICVSDRLIASNKQCPFTTDDGTTGYERIDVYASDNACYLYYAIVRSDSSKTPYTVIENSGYGKDETIVGFRQDRHKAGDYRYYIIYEGRYCYFNL